MGLIPFGLWLACLHAIRNQRILAAWNSRQADNQRRAAAGLPPEHANAGEEPPSPASPPRHNQARFYRGGGAEDRAHLRGRLGRVHHVDGKTTTEHGHERVPGADRLGGGDRDGARSVVASAGTVPARSGRRAGAGLAGRPQ